jgi:hypothetical protein
MPINFMTFTQKIYHCFENISTFLNQDLKSQFQLGLATPWMRRNKCPGMEGIQSPFWDSLLCGIAHPR